MPNFELYDFMDAISPVVAFSEFGGIVNDLIAFIGCVKLTSSYEIIAECFFKKSTPKTMVCDRFGIIAKLCVNGIFPIFRVRTAFLVTFNFEPSAK